MSSRRNIDSRRKQLERTPTSHIRGAHELPNANEVQYPDTLYRARSGFLSDVLSAEFETDYEGVRGISKDIQLVKEITQDAEIVKREIGQLSNGDQWITFTGAEAGKRFTIETRGFFFPDGNFPIEFFVSLIERTPSGGLSTYYDQGRLLGNELLPGSLLISDVDEIQLSITSRGGNPIIYPTIASSFGVSLYVELPMPDVPLSPRIEQIQVVSASPVPGSNAEFIFIPNFGQLQRYYG